MGSPVGDIAHSRISILSATMSRLTCHESRDARIAAERRAAHPREGLTRLTDRSKLIGVALGLWLALEILSFAFVLRSLGLLATIALGLGTTALGLSDVKRLLTVWRERGKLRPDGAMLDGLLQALASLLLILPGFASDIFGLALKSPSVRAAAMNRIRNRGQAPRAPEGPQVVDLDPREWKHLTPSGRPKRKRKKADGLTATKG
jgi:UPF0716 protein FxsA